MRKTLEHSSIQELQEKTLPIEQVIKDLRYRSDNRTSTIYPYVGDMQIEWDDTPVADHFSGYYATIDGKRLPLDNNAVATACDLIKVRSDHFSQYFDKLAFAEALKNIIDANPARKQKGVLVRHDGISVNAILPPHYQIKDDYELVNDFGSRLYDIYGEEPRVQVLSEGYGAISNYRFIIGENLLKPKAFKPGVHEANKEDTILMMTVLNTSELGLVNTEIALGLFRLVCINGALRLDQKQAVGRWNHFSPPGNFYDKSQYIIRRSGFFSQLCSQILSELREKPLKIEAFDMLNALRDRREITERHWESSGRFLDNKDNPIETEYDLFNVLTKSSQDLPSINERTKAESNSLRLAMLPNGFDGLLSGEIRQRKIKQDILGHMAPVEAENN